jgi:hypothetical protein
MFNFNKISIQTLIYTIFLSLSLGTLSAQELVEKGYRLADDSVIKDYSLLSLGLEEHVLIKHIIKTNYKVDHSDAELIAKNILKVSQCFNIDPWLLTAVIQKESSFKKDAISPTGAAGLSQFTMLGLQEVNDQLGFRGRAEATDMAIDFYNSKISKCIDPEWTHLWLKVGVSETDPEFYNLLKEEIKQNIPIAITYGAILLKTYVAFVDNKFRNSYIKLPTSETYFLGLQIYNGEEGDAKVKYAKEVFKNLKAFYPRELTFPFLID